MATKQKQTLQLSQQHNIAQIELMKYVQMPALEFEAHLQTLLIENPYLELKPNEQLTAPPSSSDSENELNDDLSKESLYEVDDEGKFDWDKNDPNFLPEFEGEAPVFNIQNAEDQYDFSHQIQSLNLDTTKTQLIEFIFENLEEDGYLKTPTVTLMNDISIQFGLDLNSTDLELLINIIQSLDPPGIGARSLQECLSIQLQRLPESTPYKNLAIQLINDYFTEISKHNYNAICNALTLKMEDLNLGLNLISNLKPRPIEYLHNKEIKKQNIIPDFFVTSENDQLFLSLHPNNECKIQLSPEIEKSLHDTKLKTKKDAQYFYKNYLESGQYLVKLIELRQKTLTNTMKAIMQKQKTFFLNGDPDSLKPMLLKDIEKLTGFDESTISRVVNSKYVQTEFGIYKLKFLFNKAIQITQSHKTGTVTKLQLLKVIQNIIDTEDKLNPLNDKQMVEILNQKGFDIKQRMVVNYRKELNIPQASERKQNTPHNL